MQSAHINTIHVKFKEQFKPDMLINGRTAKSGVGKVDVINERHKALTIKRIFPEAGVFEEAHRAYGLHLWYEIKFSNNVNLKHAVEDYRGIEYFDNVEASRPYSAVHENSNAELLPTLPSGANDPFFESQWHFENHGQTDGMPGADIKLLKAWQKESGSPNVIVAVIDGGININHPDLKDALWVNADEIPANGKDDDRNGYIDDIHGFNFGDWNSILYPDDHATHVAGTIGAVSNNGIGVSGIAGGNGAEPGIKLMSCVGFGNFEIGGFESAMIYAADNGAVISQNSWGGGSSAIEAAITYFINRAGYDNSAANFSKNIQTGPMAGGVVIFAAGNSNTWDPYYGYPASYDKVISVASTDHYDTKSSFSNYGYWVDISAPGSDVYSTMGSSYGFLSGTSMACPHVSGVAALIVSNLQRPGLKPNEIWNRLRLSARSIKDANPSSLDGLLGWGRLDASLALREPDVIPPGRIGDLQVVNIHSTSLLLRWTATGENYVEGQSAEYEIRYSTNPIDQSNFNEGTILSLPPTPPPSGEQAEYEVANLLPATTYYFALKSVDVFNNISSLSNVASATTLKLPLPELITTQVSEQLYTGAVSTKHVLVKNIGEEGDLLVRAGTPKLENAPVISPLGAKGRLFAINSNQNTIEELNAQTGEIIYTIPMPEPSSRTLEGLAFDGVYLYYGRSKNIYKINAETGDVVRTIRLGDTYAIKGLAWSGRYLYVSKNGKICELDVDTDSILRTMDGNSELAYLGSSNTLLLADASRLMEMKIESGAFTREIAGTSNPKCIAFSIIDSLIFVSDRYESSIRAIRYTDGKNMYTIPYPVTTALAGIEHRFDWLETSEQVIAIPPGQTGEVPITFVTAGLAEGTLTGSVNIISLNSNTGPLPVNVRLTSLSGTDIETAKEINLGKRFLGFSVDTTIIVENRGFTDLLISQIQSNDNRVTSSLSSVTLAPGQKTNLIVSVDQSSPGTIEALITFNSNDPDEGTLSVPVKVTLLEAPAITVNPLSLTATLNSGATNELTFNLTNTGNSVLHWNANLTGSDSQGITQLVNEQQGSPIPVDSVYKSTVGEISVKSSSPEPVAYLVYDPVGELIYARAWSTLYTYSPALDRWNTVGIVPSNFHGGAAYQDGKIYYGDTQLNVYTIQSNSWRSILLPLAETVTGITSDDTYLYVAIKKALYRFDPSSENWLKLASTPNVFFMTGFSSLSHHSGVIYATGAQTFTGDRNTIFLKYFIDSNTWIHTNSISGTVDGGAIDPSTARYFVLAGMRISILDIREGEWTAIGAPFSTIGSITYVGTDKHSGMYFTGTENKFGYYETPAVPKWFTITPPMGSLAVGETQTISIDLNAQSLFGGIYTGNVHVYSTRPAIEKNISLELTVLGTPEVSLDKDSIKFHSFVLGSGSRFANIKIRNKGSAELVVSNVSTNNPEFQVSQTSFTVPVGESTRVGVTYNPASIGQQKAVLTFHSNDPLNREFSLKLTGTAVHSAQLQVPTDTIKATLFTGGITKQKITVSNIGEGSTLYMGAGGNDQWLKVYAAEAPPNIDAHQDREFNAVINATGLSQGVYDGHFWFEDHLNQIDTPVHIPARLTVIDAPNLLVSADSIDFKDRFIGKQYDSVFQIKNTGFLPLTISSISSENSAFTISAHAPLELYPGESINATVSFNPITAGSQRAAITLGSNDPNHGIRMIYLNGNGVNPPKLSLSEESLALSIYEHESQSVPIDISNVGGSLLKWSILEQSDTLSSAGGFINKQETPTNSLLGLTTDPATGLLYGHSYESQEIYVYNAQSDLWSKKGHTMYPEYNFKNSGAVIVDSKMYCTYLEDGSKMYIYDMIKKNWSTKRSTLGAGSAMITSDGTLLYLAGGGKFKSYHPFTNEWTELSIPNFTLDGLGGLSYLNGAIYAHAAGSNNFAKYTIETDIWENLIPLPEKASLGCTIDPVRQRYYAYEGNYLYEYDIQSNTWTVLHISLFETGDSGGLTYAAMSGNEGVYLLQGSIGKSFAHYQVKDELAWLRSSHLAGEVEPMSWSTIGINCNATNLAPGMYHGRVNVTSNDPEKLTYYIPVTLAIKRAAPTINVPSLIADSVNRSTSITYYLPIKNEGRELLEWDLEDTLPSWLTVDKSSGNISSQHVDSIEFTFNTALFWSGVGDYTLEINSNDPLMPKFFTRILLTLQNRQPVLKTAIPDQILDSPQIEIPLLEYITDPDNDYINFYVSLSNDSLVSANMVNSQLLINPVKSGVLTAIVTAVDIYNASFSTSFEINNLITGIEQVSKERGFSASPNPFLDKVILNLNEHRFEEATIALFDFTGKEAYILNRIDLPSQGELEINLGHLSSGLYTCILFVNGKLTESIRILKH